MELRALPPESSLLGAAAECYRETHASPDPPAVVRDRFERHATYPGWRGYVALSDFDHTVAADADGGASASRVVGYVYGYSSGEDQRYHRQLRDCLPHHLAARWLADCFELVELGVHPDCRREGVATALHDAILADVQHETAVLTTGVDNAAAHAFYDELGWIHVWEPFRFEGGRPMTVLGKPV